MTSTTRTTNHKRTGKALKFGLCLGLALCGTIPALANDGTATQQPSQVKAGDAVYVVDQDLRSLLREFGKRIGANPVLSKGIEGRVKKAFIPTERQAFLDEMSRSYGIEWYFEGTTLHLSSRDEITSRLIGIKSLSVKTINSQIQKVDLNPARYPLQPVPEANAAMLTAPPSYIARVEIITESILKAKKENGEDTIRFIKFGRKSIE